MHTLYCIGGSTYGFSEKKSRIRGFAYHRLPRRIFALALIHARPQCGKGLCTGMVITHASPDWILFAFSLNDKVARIFLTCAISSRSKERTTVLRGGEAGQYSRA